MTEENLEEDENNPFVVPCKCAGTVRYIHIKCLQHWIQSQTHTRQTQNSISFMWKTFECELCHTTYPSFNIKKLNNYIILF